MEQSRQNTWTMKHPALAKAFAVLFAVMSIILLLAGASGIGKAQEDNAERVRYEKKFAERIANYEELTKKLEHSITYEELWEELEKEIEQHDDDASQHRTDLALHTAEKGGYTMGANMIWEAVPDMNGSKRQLAIAKYQLAAGAEQIEMLRPMLAEAEAGIALLKSSSDSCYTLRDTLNSMISNAKQPDVSNSGQEEVNSENVNSENINSENINSEDVNSEDVNSEDMDSEDMNSEDMNSEDMDSEDVNSEDMDSEDVNPEDVNSEDMDSEDVNPEDVNSEDVNLEDTNPENTNQEKTNPENADAGNALSTAAVADPGPDSTVYSKRNLRIRYADSVSVPVPSYIYDSANQLAAGLSAMNPQFSLPQGLDAAGLADALDKMGGMYYAAYEAALQDEGYKQLKSAVDGYDEAVKAIATGEAGLAMAQGQLENIWYELGQLDEEHEELTETRDILNEEAARLSKEIVEADELHELENDRTSAKLLLTSVKEVNDMVEGGGEIVPSAQKYLEDYKAQTQLQHKGWLASCILAILGGIAGLLAIPAAYELVRKRSWLIIPAIVSVVLAAAAEGAYYAVGLGWWYVGMFAAIIGLIHLIIVAPKEKKPGAV